MRRLRELNEEVSHASRLEELLLRFLAVLVHRVADQLEVNGSALHDSLDVLLLVMVGEYDREDGGCELQELLYVHWSICLRSEYCARNWSLLSGMVTFLVLCLVTSNFVGWIQIEEVIAETVGHVV